MNANLVGKTAGVPEWLRERFRCPDCHSPHIQEIDTALVCGHCKTVFPLVRGRPVLIRTDNELFPRSSYANDPPQTRASWLQTITKLAPSRSVNMTYRQNLHAFAESVRKVGGTVVLVIGAGSQKDWLDSLFEGYPDVRLVYTDVDIRGTVDLFCDAHDLPFEDEAFSGVIASAVLEHVVYPERVVGEIHRVLEKHSYVYSEIPFLQQVHEGAYDFTRFTLSGHRRLLNHFEELASGVVAGPGTALTWALEHFAVALSPRPLAMPTRAAVRTAFFWLKYFDYVFKQSPAAADGASCTFFLGRKSTSIRTDRDIVERYSGLKALRHV